MNGTYVEEEQAKISCFDRGFLFSDGVYEVTAVLNGGCVQVDSKAHFDRLRRSLSELQIAYPQYDLERCGVPSNHTRGNAGS